ncbi:hypothetical protein RI103_37280 (plasmid) [Paraburkholderia sp. FT54]|uniref:hypothetical protein n=1 Tax=Paraburkholderia sp. FT54 TaxID=3074437 RepID=UPI0028774115|nr:hypothetical protein [Paraburkholderia sp. FT54]WNC95394.1 hypothetical protein RI103_37280 [Paraburkholderia sp. FT54]
MDIQPSRYFGQIRGRDGLERDRHFIEIVLVAAVNPGSSRLRRVRSQGLPDLNDAQLAGGGPDRDAGASAIGRVFVSMCHCSDFSSGLRISYGPADTFVARVTAWRTAHVRGRAVTAPLPGARGVTNGPWPKGRGPGRRRIT